MSDNEDLLGDDLGDQSLADYNLGNEEEEQLLADDYENAAPQNVPISIGPGFRDPIENMVPQPQEYQAPEYGNQPVPYQPVRDAECVVPNIAAEVPNTPVRSLPSYAPYEPPPYEEHAVPPAMPAVSLESPQIVPSDLVTPISNGSHVDMGELGPRERFISERPPGVQRMPQVRDIPDSLDKVVIPRGGWTPGPVGGVRGRTSWRSASFQARFGQPHPYRRNNMLRANFNQRASFPSLQIRPNSTHMRLENRPEIRPNTRLDNRPDTRPEIRPDMHSDNRPESRPEQPPELIRPEIRPELIHQPQMGPEISPERPILQQDMPMFRPPMERPPFHTRYQFRPNMDERPQFGPRPNFDPRFFRPNYPPGQFPPPMREIPPGMAGPGLDKMGPKMDLPREPEVRMLPVSLPPNLPPGGLAGKKVLINPHFKGNFQPPIEGLPAYIPTRIQKSPPPNATIENKFGPGTDIDDAAERFIAEQRNALARAAVRKQARRSPQRQIYIENTTIEIENEFAHGPYRRADDDDLLRRQEEFINANRAGLRRRMRSPSPARRSLSPRRSPPPVDRERHERRPRAEDSRHYQEDSEYQRKVREQENLRERVLRAKEVRRRKNAVALQKQLQDRERENQDASPKSESKPVAPIETTDKPTSTDPDTKPDTTRSSPEKEKARVETVRDRSPMREGAQVNSTVENLTPPHRAPVKSESPERALTPPLPERRDDKRTDSDDDLDLILGDIDGILSDDEDSGRFKEKSKKSEATKSKPPVDLRSKLPPKNSSHESKKSQRQKIVFNEEREERRKREKSPSRRAVVTSSTKSDDTESVADSKKAKTKAKLDSFSIKSRQRITYDEEAEKESDDKKSSFSNRRVILQRKTAAPVKDKSVFSRMDKTDPSKPNPGIFSRAVRTAIGNESTRVVVKKDEPQIQFESDSDMDEDAPLEETGNTATVTNLPHGMTDTRLKTLAGNDVQNLILDKEERTAKITFKSTAAADSFKKKFNNKMVAASRLSVTLR